jgi:4-hydroxybenzoate polyprenyltransferase
LLAGYFAAKQGEIPFIPILGALFFIWARELIETISDDAGDQVDHRDSVYALWGKTRVLRLVFVLLITSVIMLLVPLFTIDLASRLLYLLTIILLLILPVTIAAIAILRDQSPMNIRNVAHWVGVVFFSSAVAFLWLV